ncbi:MAG: hypothetical protein K6B65_01365 [Bacilli bacterium]|nr:hypothetical protein [Bacilli bacterium]
MKATGKNKSRFLLSLSALAVLPLLMGNSPAPYRGPTPYGDYKINNFAIHKASGIEQTLYSHSFDVENTGNGYMPLAYYGASRSDNGQALASFSEYRSNEVIAPNTSYHLYFLHEEEVVYENIDFTFYAFSDAFAPDAISIDNIGNLEKEKVEDGGGYFYTFTCDVHLNVDEYGSYYNPIFKFSDGSSVHYFYGETLRGDYGFYCDADFDMSLLKIEAVTFIKGYDYYKDRGHSSADSFVRTTFFVIVILGLSLTLAGAIVASILLIRHIKKSKG